MVRAILPTTHLVVVGRQEKSADSEPFPSADTPPPRDSDPLQFTGRAPRGMSAYSAFLSHFSTQKPVSGQVLVCCPAHEDKTPSLAVKESADGTVLLTC